MCAAGEAFAPAGTATAQGETGGYKNGVLPTNDGKYVLVADYLNNRIVVYSPKDLSYLTEWTGISEPSFLAQASGTGGPLFVTNYNSVTLTELDPTSANPSATIKSRALGYAGFLGVALDGMGDVLIVNDGPTKHLAHWSDDFTSASNFALPGMPFGIAADRKKGKAYITDQDNGAVVIFDIGGNQRSKMRPSSLGTSSMHSRG